MSGSIKGNKGSLLTFDFVIADLEIYYSATSPKNAYYELKRYLISKGFEHLKDSDYRHPEFSVEQSIQSAYDFAMENKWFAPCLSKLNVSPNIPVIDISTHLKIACGDIDWMNRKVAEYNGIEEAEEELEEDDELEL